MPRAGRQSKEQAIYNSPFQSESFIVSHFLLRNNCISQTVPSTVYGMYFTTYKFNKYDVFYCFER